MPYYPGPATSSNLGLVEAGAGLSVVNGVLNAQTAPSFFNSGVYYPPPGLETNGSYTSGWLVLGPLYVPRAVTLNSIAVNVTSAGDATSTVTPCVYADNGAGYPGSLVVSGGAQPGNAVGVSMPIISQALTPALYWVGAMMLWTTTTITVASNGPPCAIQTGDTSAFTITAYSVCGYVQSGLSALPSTFTSSVAGVTLVPRVAIRAA